MTAKNSRREFLYLGGATGAALFAGSAEMVAAAEDKAKGKAEEEDEAGAVSPAEDLMREHGVLKRILLVYEEVVRRIETQKDFHPESLADAARIIRTFVEDYHEKLEEDFLFPRFKKARKLVDLVDVLSAQHKAGRRLTDVTLRLANSQAFKRPDDRRRLSESLRLFVRMYSPHEAREDTVLFPALEEIVSLNEYDALGEEFEKREHQLFGDDGFGKMVDKVATIEKSLGIYDLAQFTPKLD